MKKTFCDICEKPAIEDNRNILMVDDRKISRDKTAKIYLTLHVGFKDHSSGFGGPPDLCRDCFLDLISKLEAHIIKTVKI